MCANFILPCGENHYGFFLRCPTSFYNRPIYFIIVGSINEKFLVPVTESQENILSGLNTALFELLIQPGQIQPHTLEVAFQNPAIHNQLSKRQFLFRRQIHVAGRYRALGTHWKNRQPPVKIENCGLDIGEVKVSLLPAHNTNHADAFSKAVQLFDPASGNAKVMVIFTDGNTTTGAPPAPVATAAKAQGIIIYCIGLIGSDGLDISALNDWATDPDASHVAVTPDTADLEALFAQLAANISKPGATDIIINEAVNPDFVTLLFLKLKIPALQAFLSRRAYVTALL